MAITAKEIQEQGFEHSRKGYDVEEVDVFLEHVAEEVDSLNRQNSELRLSLSEAQEATQMVNPVDSNPALSVELAEAQSQIADLKKRLQARNADTEAISSAIIAAQKSADKIRQDARDDAKRIFDEAEAKARAVIRDALDRKKKTTDEIARLKDLRARFQTEYFAMIKKFQESGSEHFSEGDDIFDIDLSSYEDDFSLDDYESESEDAEKTGTMNPIDDLEPISAAPNPVPAPASKHASSPMSSYGDTEDVDIDFADLD